MRDIIRGMFKSDRDFNNHVTVIFTFSDKAPLDDHNEWLSEFLGDLPVPASISYWGKDMPRDDLMDALDRAQVSETI